MIDQERNESVSVGFLDDDAGGTVCNGGIVDFRIGIVAADKLLYFSPAPYSLTSVTTFQ